MLEHMNFRLQQHWNLRRNQYFGVWWFNTTTTSSRKCCVSPTKKFRTINYFLANFIFLWTCTQYATARRHNFRKCTQWLANWRTEVWTYCYCYYISKKKKERGIFNLSLLKPYFFMTSLFSKKKYHQYIGTHGLIVSYKNSIITSLNFHCITR